MSSVENIHIASEDILTTPEELKQKLPLTDKAQRAVEENRQAVYNILNKKDHRIIVVVGPCSIHDVKAAKAYAEKLRVLSEELNDTLLIVMRVYFEKPRTSIGWKGLINDPYLNDTFKIEEGLNIGRKLLLDISEMGLATSTEALDPITPQYIHDLISWTAIGARTTESQRHREMSSGLSSAVGFKNGTDGGLGVAINAMQSVKSPHRFLGINEQGQVSVITTKGNPYAHIVLRGGGGKPNYDSVSVAQCEKACEKGGVSTNIMIDCSHANSNKDASLQPLVLDNISNQIVEGNQSIVGIMLESNLHFGNQPIKENLDEMQYGVSVTDACIDWQTTEESLRTMRDKLKDVLPGRIQS